MKLRILALVSLVSFLTTSMALADLTTKQQVLADCGALLSARIIDDATFTKLALLEPDFFIANKWGDVKLGMIKKGLAAKGVSSRKFERLGASLRGFVFTSTPRLGEVKKIQGPDGMPRNDETKWAQGVGRLVSHGPGIVFHRYDKFLAPALPALPAPKLWSERLD